MSNFVHAVRALRKNPGFSLVAVLTIGVGIGANASIFSLYDRLVLHPMTIPDSSTLIAIWSSNPQANLIAPTTSWPRYEEIRDGAHGLTSVAVSAFENFTLTGNGDPAQLNSLRVSASFFPTLGVMPAHGRNFTGDEDQPNGPTVCVISHELWQTVFGGRPLVGQVITLNGQSWEVVGIMPPHLTAPFDQVQVFAPRVFEASGLTLSRAQSGYGYAQTIARLRPGVTLAQARGELGNISRTSHDSFPTRLDANNTSEPRLFVDALVGNLEPTFHALLGAVAFVLLIACANVAALFLSRLTSRRKEIAVRQSLGATRQQIVSQFIVESVIFSTVAAAVGTLLAWSGLSAIQSLLVPQLGPNATFTLNARVLLFTAAVSATTAFLVAFVPAVQASRGPVADMLKDTSRGLSSAGGERLRGALLVAEVALSVVLLVGAGLLVVSFLRLQRTSPGYEPRGAAMALVGIPLTRYRTPDHQAQFFDQVVERLRARPDVADAAVALGLPLGGYKPQAPYSVGGRLVLPSPKRPLANLVIVSDSYFRLMAIPIVEGRPFNTSDRDGSREVCILNKSFAKGLFPGESALGKIILRGRNADIAAEIVGIVDDVRANGLNYPAPDEIYYPMRQMARSNMSVIARTTGDANRLQTAIRAAVAQVDPNQPISFFTTLEANVANSLGVQRIIAWLATVFAAIALVLSAVGLYSVVAYSVSQRTPEIGIRIALGAQRAQVVGLVMRGGLRFVAAGLALGLAAAVVAGRLMRTLLHDVQPVDPWIYGAVAMLFTGIAAVACLIPSLRASRIDALRVLGVE